MRVMLQDVLTEAGYQVLTACDGEEAWHILDEESDGIDLVILDLLMPRMTGFEVLENIQENQLDQRVLVVTGIFKSDKEIDRLKELGATGYITKTALVDEVLFRVNQVFHMGQSNSRNHPRLLKSLPVTYKINGEQYANYTSNFSAGGTFIRTIDPAPSEEIVEIQFKIPELDLPVKATGLVVWNNEYETYCKKSSLPGMGVKFIHIDPSVQERIAAFINEKLVSEPVWLR